MAFGTPSTNPLPQSPCLCYPWDQQNKSSIPSGASKNTGFPIHPAPRQGLQNLSRRCRPTAFLITNPPPPPSSGLQSLYFRQEMLRGIGLSSSTQFWAINRRLVAIWKQNKSKLEASLFIRENQRKRKLNRPLLGVRTNHKDWPQKTIPARRNQFS